MRMMRARYSGLCLNVVLVQWTWNCVIYNRKIRSDGWRNPKRPDFHYKSWYNFFKCITVNHLILISYHFPLSSNRVCISRNKFRQAFSFKSKSWCFVLFNCPGRTKRSVYGSKQIKTASLRHSVEFCLRRSFYGIFAYKLRNVYRAVFGLSCEKSLNYLYTLSHRII